jgi:hypothetical protein
MSAFRYFENFPIVQYSNNSVVDITKRVVVLESVSKNPFAFYPYELDVFERPDQFSYRYYQDPYQSWLIYLANKITDPYYEWYLSDGEFNDFIQQKYGSIYLAQTKIKNYRNNWINSENITPSEYNALPASLKDYWEPLYGVSNAVTSYSRKKVDWATSTNKIVYYQVNSTNNFIQDEIVNIVYDANTIGKGQILSISNNTLHVQHVSGDYDFTPAVASYIYGTESESNTIFTSFNYSSNNISAEEESYWSAVTYYEYENDRNEFNKTVRVLDNRYNGIAINDLKRLMKE